MSESDAGGYPYRALATGVLDLPPARGRARERTRRPQLRLSGPLGGDFVLPIRVVRQIPGSELLDGSYHGTRLAVEGCIDWGVPASDSTSLPSLTAEAVRIVAPEEEDGCDVWLCGEIVAPPRIGRHPLRQSVVLAHLSLRVRVSHARSGSRALLTETIRVPLVIPLNHTGAPALLRPGNRVAVEGMLERVPIPRRGHEIDEALAALEEATRKRLSWTMEPEEAREIERTSARRRWEITHTATSRVIAGYVELLHGAPASIREAQAQRRAEIQRRASSHHSQ